MVVAASVLWIHSFQTNLNADVIRVTATLRITSVLVGYLVFWDAPFWVGWIFLVFHLEINKLALLLAD